DEAEGMKRRPRDDLSWVARGIYQLRSDPKAAVADFDEALKINPRCRQALMSKAHALAERLERQKEASEVLGRLLEAYPDHVLALSGRAVVLARRKQREKAHQHIARALKLDSNGEVLYQAACVHALTSQKVPSDA